MYANILKEYAREWRTEHPEVSRLISQMQRGAAREDETMWSVQERVASARCCSGG